MIYRSLWLRVVFLALSGLVLSSCAELGIPEFTPTPPPDTVLTQTAQAELTQQAVQTLVAQVTELSSEQGTPFPNIPATSTAGTPVPGDGGNGIVGGTPVPGTPSPGDGLPPSSVTPVPATFTPGSPAPTTRPCNWAQVVADLNLPDGAILPPNSAFTKVWQLQNVGDCTWGQGYEVVFVSGTPLSIRQNWSVPRIVSPRETVDIALNLVTPAFEGRYRSYWMLRNPDGSLFGIGPEAQTAFWVDIEVRRDQIGPYRYDFATNMCSAAWQSGAGWLACPGFLDDASGSVVLLDRPMLETGATEDEPTLWMHPEHVDGGWIQGVYPAYTVRSGDRFLADIGCLANSDNCDVIFSVDFQSGNMAGNLGRWQEEYDEELTRVDLDLTHLAGQSVQFILSVTANSSPGDANAFWLAPSIRPGAAPPLPPDTPTLLAVRLTIARALGVDEDLVVIQSVEQHTWQDTCMGVYVPNEVCTPLVVPGYDILLTVDGDEYKAHTTLDGSVIKWFER